MGKTELELMQEENAALKAELSDAKTKMTRLIAASAAINERFESMQKKVSDITARQLAMMMKPKSL